MNPHNSTLIFITGNSRSGTTMMSRILGNHSKVFTFQELHFFDELIQESKVNELIEHKNAVKLFALLLAIQRNGYFGSRNINPFIDEANNIIGSYSELTYIELFRIFLLYETEKSNKSIPCEQTPQNVFSIDYILNSIPNAKVIIMVRDPREVLLSQKYKWKRRKLSDNAIPIIESIRSRLNYHPITISKIWCSTMETAKKYSNAKNVSIVRYEDLISDSESVLKQLSDQLGLNYETNLTDIPVVGSSNFNDSLKRGIDTSKTLQWKNGGLNTTEIEICQRINAKLMNQFKYELGYVNYSSLKILFYKITLPIKLSAALLFNLHRLKNPGKLLKRFFGN